MANKFVKNTSDKLSSEDDQRPQEAFSKSASEESLQNEKVVDSSKPKSMFSKFKSASKGKSKATLGK